MPSYKDEATGKWYCSFYYTDLRGKRVRKLKRGFKFKRDADKWEREFLSTEHPNEIAMRVLIEETKKAIENEFKLGNIKESTMVAKKNRLRLYVEPYFKDEIASNIKPKHIVEWLKVISVIDLKPLKTVNYYYRNRTEEQRKKKRSSQTVNQARAILKEVFDYGKLNFGLKENPVDSVKRVAANSPDERAKIWSIEQFEKFKSVLKRRDMIVMFDIMFYAGLRIGELLQLTPSDITPYKIHIDKALMQLDYHTAKTSTPKTENSKRDVPIPKSLYEEIQDYIKGQYNIKETDVIFDIEEQTIRTHLNANALRAGLPRISPHILRHSYASHMFKAYKDAATVAAILGDTLETFLKTYAHMVPDSDKEAIIAFEEYLEQKK